MSNVRNVMLAVISALMLTACCAPGATVTTTPTAFTATVSDISATHARATLESAQTVQLLFMDDSVSQTLLEGQTVYVTGHLLSTREVQVERVQVLAN